MSGALYIQIIEQRRDTMWTVRKTWGGWQVYRMFPIHAEVAPGAWKTEALARKEAARINAGGRAGAIKIIPALPQ